LDHDTEPLVRTLPARNLVSPPISRQASFDAAVVIGAHDVIGDPDPSGSGSGTYNGPFNGPVRAAPLQNYFKSASPRYPMSQAVDAPEPPKTHDTKVAAPEPPKTEDDAVAAGIKSFFESNPVKCLHKSNRNILGKPKCEAPQWYNVGSEYRRLLGGSVYFDETVNRWRHSIARKRGQFAEAPPAGKAGHYAFTDLKSQLEKCKDDYYLIGHEDRGTCLPVCSRCVYEAYEKYDERSARCAKTHRLDNDWSKAFPPDKCEGIE